MSNSSIIVGLLFSMFTVKSSMRPIATGVLKIWLKKNAAIDIVPELHFCSLWPSLVGGFVFFYYHRSILAHSNSMMFPNSNHLVKKSSITICMSPTATTRLVMSITSEMTFRSSFVSLKFHIPTAD
jgi:hypothetical protein